MLLQRKSVYVLLSVIVATCAREPSSPICSKYDYEERLLERVLRNEFALETTLNEILKTNAKVVDALKQLEDEKGKVESTLAVMEKKQIEMESRLSDFINNASNNMNSTLAANVVSMVNAASEIKANASVTRQQLVNEVRIIKDLSSGQDVVFPTVQVNEGQGYAPSTGKFTASIPGMYLFSVQYCVAYKKDAGLEIVHQGKTLQRSHNYVRSNDYPCVTMQVSAPVATGHQVWVRTTIESKLYADSNAFTLFSGTLIHV